MMDESAGIGPNQSTHLVGHNNIVIGNGAGRWLTDESYRFVARIGDVEFRTVMTHEEYEVVHEVVLRSMSAPIELVVM